jgi:acylphosphatase
MSVGRHARVTGRVQGVFFRAWTQEQAREVGVAGWVRNCADGSVEAHLEGDEDAVATLISRMRDGPPSARVSDVKVGEVAPDGLVGFVVRH